MLRSTILPLETFVKSYIEAAFWSSTDDEDNPLDDNYDSSNISQELLVKINDECSKFLVIAEEKEIHIDDYSQAGHDFWLTRNHHGCGFWDGDWGDDGILLTEISHSFGQCDLYIGDDGLIYC